MVHSDGKYEIQGMVKGTPEETAPHAIAKDTYVGIPLAGAARDHGIADSRPLSLDQTLRACLNRFSRVCFDPRRRPAAAGLNKAVDVQQGD